MKQLIYALGLLATHSALAFTTGGCIDSHHNQAELRALIDAARTMAPVRTYKLKEVYTCRLIPGYSCQNTTQTGLPARVLVKRVLMPNGGEEMASIFESSQGVPAFAERTHLYYQRAQLVVEEGVLKDAVNGTAMGHIRKDDFGHLLAFITTPFPLTAPMILNDEADAPVLMNLVPG